MIKNFLAQVAIVCALVASTAVSAQTGKAPCGAFAKLPEWRVLKPVKIENGNLSTMVGAGTLIVPGTRVTGVDLYAALEKSCH
jgi:hypothetical protein